MIRKFKNIEDFLCSDDSFLATTKTENKIIQSKANIFRPRNFLEYKGQDRAKAILTHYIKEIKERNLHFPHTLIFGETGAGKTTLAQIIAKTLNITFHGMIASSVKDEKDILDHLQKVNGGMLFLDEIHSLDRELAEKFYPIMEDFSCNNQALIPFTLVGATTELGELIEDRKPLYDRFRIILELEPYRLEDLITIAKQYKETLFATDNLEEDKFKTIAENCRNNPRTLIRLLEATIYFEGNIDEVLKMFGILENGFTEKDLKVLEYVALNQGGVGLTGLATYLDTSANNYIYYIEPFLLKNGLIVKTGRGRKITTKGLQLIETIKK